MTTGGEGGLRPLSTLNIRARIFKRLRSPGIDSKEWIPPVYVAWRAGTSNRVVVPARKAGNRFLDSFEGLQIRAQFNAGPQKKRNYLLIRLFSFSVFSYNAYFHLASSPMTHIFIQRILLLRQFSFRAFSNDAYFHYASSPMTPTFIPRILLRRLRKKEGAERKSHFGKTLRDPKCKFSKKIR